MWYGSTSKPASPTSCRAAHKAPYRRQVTPRLIHYSASIYALKTEKLATCLYSPCSGADYETFIWWRYCIGVSQVHFNGPARYTACVFYYWEKRDFGFNQIARPAIIL